MQKKSAVIATCMIMSVAIYSPIRADDLDTDRSHPKAFIKDSAITAKIKAKLAADHFSSLAMLHVDTDAAGVVWLSGSAHTQDEMDHAIAVARATEGVKEVRSSITIKLDD